MQRTVVARGTTYRIEFLEPPRMDALVPLLRRAYGRTDFTPEWLAGKYAGRFGGVSAFSCVALTEAGEVAAAFGMLPWPIRGGDREEVAVQAVDAATDVAHRKRGLFQHLVEASEARCREAGATFAFAFPHPDGQSYPLFMKHLGYTHLHDLVEFRLATGVLPVERVARRLPGARSLYAAFLGRALRGVAPPDPVLDNSLLREGFCATHRGPEWHAYKSFAANRVVQLDGGRAWVKVRRGLLVGDLEAEDDAGLGRTAAALGRLARRAGIDEVIFQASQDTRFTRVMPRHYRTVPCLSVVYRNWTSRLPPQRLRFTFGDLDNF